MGRSLEDVVEELAELRSAFLSCIKEKKEVVVKTCIGNLLFTFYKNNAVIVKQI